MTICLSTAMLVAFTIYHAVFYLHADYGMKANVSMYTKAGVCAVQMLRKLESTVVQGHDRHVLSAHSMCV